MKILMLAHRYPYPPARGDAIRAWGEVQYLSKRHDVWLACVDRVQPWPEHLAAAQRCCRDVAVVVRSGTASLVRGGWSMLVGYSLTEGYFHDPRLFDILRRWDDAVDFDAVLTFSPAMAPYAMAVRAKRRVLDMNDVESDKWHTYAHRSLSPLRPLYAIEAARLPRAEAQWIRGHDVSLLVNERERQKVPAELREATAVVRTGVDLQRYARCASEDVPAGPVLGYLGSMSYPPNVRAVNWFGKHVWPLVHAAIPTARWLIVGSRPTRSVRRWGELPNVRVTGFVEDVRPRLRSMRVFVCPVREQIGVQTKLIEAMAAGRASVVTPEVAAGIEPDDPPPFIVAGTAREFADAVIRLLRDDAHARTLSQRARLLAEARYGDQDQMRLIERWLVGDNTDAPRTQPCENVAAIKPIGAHV